MPKLRPPSMEMVEAQLEQLCRLANGESPTVFIHPVVRAKYERSFLLCETDDNDLTYFLLAQVEVIEQAITNLHAYLERKANELAMLQRRLEGTDGLNHRQLALLRHALRHAGFRYTVVSHQSSHGISNQTARSDLQKLAGRGLLTLEKDGKRDIFRVPVDLPTRLQA